MSVPEYGVKSHDRRADKWTIGALAHAAGVGVEMIRFYQRRGLLPQPARPCGSVRHYGKAELGRLQFVRRAQQPGFTLEEIAELLRLKEVRGLLADALSEFLAAAMKKRAAVWLPSESAGSRWAEPIAALQALVTDARAFCVPVASR